MRSKKHSARRIISLLLTVAAVFTLCSCSQGVGIGSNAKPTPDDPIQATPIINYDKITDITWLRVADEPLSEEVLDFMLMNFGIKINEKFFPSQNMSSEILDMYVSGMIPDITTGITTADAKKLANRGYFIDLNDYKSELSDYFALWSDNQSGWEYTLDEIGAKDELYCLVPENRSTLTSWIYNKDVFKAEGIAYPTTIDELYVALVTYKEAHSASSVLWTNRYESRHMEALLSAYGLTTEVWQADKNGDVFYLYAQKSWYKALEWLSKLMKLGVVPSEKGQIKSYKDSEYETVTSNKLQIIEFTQCYNYLYLTNKQSNGQWIHGDSMISQDGNTPKLLMNTPYIDEAVCISSEADENVVSTLLALVNWLCTDEGNIWTNFGSASSEYTINANGEMEFIKFYSDEVTPDIDPKKSGSVSDVTLGRMLALVPWDKVRVKGYTDRYSAQDEFLKNANVDLKYQTVFCDGVDVLEDKTQLWNYNNILSRLEQLTEDFIEFTLDNGFSDYYWDRYYNSLIEAGLLEYTDYMQQRKLR